MRQRKEQSESKIVRAKLDVRHSPTQKSRAGKDIPIPIKSDFMKSIKQSYAETETFLILLVNASNILRFRGSFVD